MKTEPSKSFTVIIPDATTHRSVKYLEALREGTLLPGRLLSQKLPADLRLMSANDLLAELVDTKKPQIFAESAMFGDGTDWNLEELGLLGDISVAVPVQIFDNGHHTEPNTHPVPFDGTLIFTPGALLENGCGCTPADWNEVVDSDEEISAEGYYGLYHRRLLPVLKEIELQSKNSGSQALITVPGLGCGQFAGPFRGSLGGKLEYVLRRLLNEHGQDFQNIRAVYFDPYNECSNQRETIHGTEFLVRPLTAPGNAMKPQLCHPSNYSERASEFQECSLFSIVAWDHVSWPGNDFFIGSRSTDDGVKAAATDSMFKLTGVMGTYYEACNKYIPPPGFRRWKDVVEVERKRGLRLL